MKKIVLLFVSAIFITACSGKEQPQTQEKKTVVTPAKQKSVSACTINGHDCWKVVQLLEQTKAISPSQEEINQYIETHFPLKEVTMGNGLPITDAKTGKPLLRRDIGPLGEFEIRQKLTRYENPELQQMGITVINASHYYDGGSVSYDFLDGTTIFRKWNGMGPDWGWADTTISFPTLESFVLNKKGTTIKHSPAQDCIVNHTSCARLTQELNRFFIDKPNLKKYLCGRGNNRRECYDETTCDENNLCATGFRSSDQQLVGVSAENSQQTGETYTYTLDDGRTLLFNWESNDPEHGYLTVTETDGTQKKFDPQGKRVN